MAGFMGVYTHIWTNSSSDPSSLADNDKTSNQEDILDPSELFDDLDNSDINYLLSGADTESSQAAKPSTLLSNSQDESEQVVLATDAGCSCALITDKMLADYQLMCSTSSYSGP